MKRISVLLLILMTGELLFAQSPNRMSYQAVIRNASNVLVVNAPVKMRISILQGSATGTAVYTELHNPTTNASGLVSLEIGGGTSPSGSIANIDWSKGPFFIKTETDPAKGTNYSIVATSQLLSVPYALNSGNGVRGVSATGDTIYLDNGKRFLIPGVRDVSAPATLNNGLVGYWPFNGNGNDESGNGNNAELLGNASYAADRYGKPNSAYIGDGQSAANILEKIIFLLGTHKDRSQYGINPSFHFLMVTDNYSLMVRISWEVVLASVPIFIILTSS